jgi:hypothetical protein
MPTNAKTKTKRAALGEIESMKPTDDLYDAKVTVLGEQIKHHVKEEEEEHSS